MRASRASLALRVSNFSAAATTGHGRRGRDAMRWQQRRQPSRAIADEHVIRSLMPTEIVVVVVVQKGQFTSASAVVEVELQIFHEV